MVVVVAASSAMTGPGLVDEHATGVVGELLEDVTATPPRRREMWEQAAAVS